MYVFCHFSYVFCTYLPETFFGAIIPCKMIPGAYYQRQSRVPDQGDSVLGMTSSHPMSSTDPKRRSRGYGNANITMTSNSHGSTGGCYTSFDTPRESHASQPSTTAGTVRCQRLVAQLPTDTNISERCGVLRNTRESLGANGQCLQSRAVR